MSVAASAASATALVWALDKYYQLRGSRIDRHRLTDSVAAIDAGAADWAGLSRMMKEVELTDLRVLPQRRPTQSLARTTSSVAGARVLTAAALRWPVRPMAVEQLLQLPMFEAVLVTPTRAVVALAV